MFVGFWFVWCVGFVVSFVLILGGLILIGLICFVCFAVVFGLC